MNDEFCTKNDGFCIQYDLLSPVRPASRPAPGLLLVARPAIWCGFAFKMMEFVLEMMNFELKMTKSATGRCNRWHRGLPRRLRRGAPASVSWDRERRPYDYRAVLRGRRCAQSSVHHASLLNVCSSHSFCKIIVNNPSSSQEPGRRHLSQTASTHAMACC